MSEEEKRTIKIEINKDNMIADSELEAQHIELLKDELLKMFDLLSERVDLAKQELKQEDYEKEYRKITEKLKKSSARYELLQTQIRKSLDSSFFPELNIFPIYSNPMTTNISRTNIPKINKLTDGKAKINTVNNKAEYTKGAVTLVFPRFNEIKGGFNIRTSKLIDFMLLIFTHTSTYKEETSYLTVSFNISDYLNFYGIENTVNNRKNWIRYIKQDAKTLATTLIEWEYTTGKGREPEVEGGSHFISDYEIGNRTGQIELTLGKKVAQSLIYGYLTKYPIALGKVTNPVAYQLGKKLSSHYSITNNVNKGINDIISVKALLEYAEDVIPSYETVKESNRNYTGRIIDPFKNGLDELVAIGVIKKWNYTNSKKKPLTKLQQENTNKYKTFKDFYIKFEMIDE